MSAKTETTAGTPGNTAVADVSNNGAFVRKEAGFRDRIKEGGDFPPQAGRYHVYFSYACPWACRVLAVLNLKGLEDAITTSSVHPTWQRTRPDDPTDTHAGWAFADLGGAPFTSPNGSGSFPADDACTPDSLYGVRFVRDLYDKVGAPVGTRFTVPILWDKKTHTVVSNESSEIIRDLNSEFNAIAKNPGLDLYPEAARGEIDAVNEWVYHSINNGVYKCGFAVSQGAYDEAMDALFEALDRAEEILSKQRYLAGGALTEADIRLFVTLARFDEVYVVYFKTNKKCIREYPNLLNYVRDVYQQPGVAETVNMAHIKTHYFTSHSVLNAHAVIPRGPNALEDFAKSHDRDRFSS